MILENLFARAAQEEAFLWLTVCGLLLGALLHLSSALRRRHAVLGALCDGLFALCAGGMVLLVLLRFGGGLRAYGLLGVVIGLVVYFAGLSRPLDALGRWLGRKGAGKISAPPSSGAGIPSSGGEVISTGPQGGPQGTAGRRE